MRVEANKTAAFPSVSVVIIGLNVAATIEACVRSVQRMAYPRRALEIIYVDGGSSDGSTDIARAAGARVVVTRHARPTPGRQRNAGARAARFDLIQFLDGDTRVHPLWLHRALPEFKGTVRAVCGLRREAHPRANWYHRIAEMDWSYPVGICDYFGGDVLIGRDDFFATGGFDEELIAGEDPELSFRLRERGARIRRLAFDATVHDCRMFHFRSYWKRGYRSGYAYGEVGARPLRTNSWRGRAPRILARAILQLTFLPGVLLAAWSLGAGALPLMPVGISLGMLVLVRPALSAWRRRAQRGDGLQDRALYVLHTGLVVIPQAAGVVRYYYARLFNAPLLNPAVSGMGGRG